MPSATAPTIDIGIAENDRRTIASGLASVLANTYALYLKTHNFHWNVTGPNFPALHAMFEEQYDALALAVDEIAERIRALGERAPGSFSAFAKLSSIPDAVGEPSADAMVRELLAGHETVARVAREVASRADDADDQVSTDLMVERLQAHEKVAWMLRSVVG